MTAKDDGGEKDQFNVSLRADVIREIKHAAIDSGQKLGEYVEGIFQDWLKRRREKGARRDER